MTITTATMKMTRLLSLLFLLFYLASVIVVANIIWIILIANIIIIIMMTLCYHFNVYVSAALVVQWWLDIAFYIISHNNRLDFRMPNCIGDTCTRHMIIYVYIHYLIPRPSNRITDVLSWFRNHFDSMEDICMTANTLKYAYHNPGDYTSINVSIVRTRGP